MPITERYTDICDKLCEFAKSDNCLRAVIVIGSTTRDDVPSDEYSDLDLIIVTDDAEKWFSGEYPDMLGKVGISFIEPTLGGGRERRCIYDKEKDVDFIIFTPRQFIKALEDGVAQWVMNRGYMFLYDSDGYKDLAEKYVEIAVSHTLVSQDEFNNLVNDFYFHNIWACKKLLRGELWSAKMCIDSYLKQRLLKMIEQYEILSSGADVWHDGRFIDRWADKTVLDGLKTAFAHYEEQDCKNALVNTHILFAKLSADVAEKLGYEYPDNARLCAYEFLQKLV